MRPVINRYLFTLSLALLCCWLSQPFALSQQNPQPTSTPAASGQDDREVVTIREVRLPITVIGKDKQPVAGLTKEDFLIYEDKQLQTTQGSSTFTDEKTSLPIYVAVL